MQTCALHALEGTLSTLTFCSAQLCRALNKTYVVSANQREDIVHLLTSLGQIRSLLTVQMGSVEEEALIKHLW